MSILPEIPNPDQPQTPPEPPPFDPANTLYNPAAPASFSVKKLAAQGDVPGGAVVIVCVRNAHTTMSVGMPKSVAKALAAAIQNEADSISDLTVAPPGLQLPSIDPRKFRPGTN